MTARGACRRPRPLCLGLDSPTQVRVARSYCYLGLLVRVTDGV